MHRRGPVVRALSALLFSSFLVACADQTALNVVVSSPLAIPDDVDRLEFRIVGLTTGAATAREFDLASGTPWPQTLTLRPGVSERAMVRIELTALHAGTFVARRVVTAAFVPGTTQTVEIVIFAECRGVRCPGELDCDANGLCEGMRDGGMPDAGPPDANVDGGPPPECTDPAMCDDGVDCTVDLCTDGMCEHRPDDALCQDGFTCDPVDDCPLLTCTEDEDCDDRRMCNGTETCAGTTCAPGTPVDCDDADACTVDVCDDRDGTCAYRTRDVDGDTHGDASCAEVGGVIADDCDDSNPDVRPGTPEDCNGIDDDCEGGCDEDFTCCRGTTGSCATTCGSTGTRTCNATCGWSVCSPPAETCNAMDDDCNGAPDDIFACVQGATRSCTTSCGSTGSQSCGSDCTWGACTAPAETCNGADDDCAGGADDGFACVQGTSAACTTSCGTTGSRACLADCSESATCTPPPEGCNSMDDDCDTRVDESSECVPGTMQACTTSCGTSGSRTCSATCTYGACAPPVEACNGSDDDCDGRIDETFPCIPTTTRTCTSSCGSMGGTQTCSASCAWGACAPPSESCNGRDDDCDTMCDDGFACCAGATGLACTTSCGTAGTRTCSAACGLSACSPPAETCNGMDDDCNAACDDTFACCAGRTLTCTTACGSTGSRVCTGTCTIPATCTPPAEACGSGDQDCDGMIDEGFACSPASTGPCTTSCGTTGTRTCDPFCAWGTCAPPTEACNTVDDDCDSMIDEGCGMCVGCTGSIAIGGTGGRYTQPTTTTSQMGTCGGSGSEYTMTFTIAATSDVFISTHGAGVDTAVYVRSCGCTGPSVGCNNDADGQTTSALRLTALAAGTYQVFVDTQGAPVGTMVPVDVYITPSAMESDRCGNPTLIPAGSTTLSGNTCTYSHDYDIINGSVAPTTCPYMGGGDAVDRVYYFYVPTMRTVTFSGCNAGTTYDSVLSIRSVCNDGTATAQRSCNDDGCAGGTTSCTAGGLRSSTSTTLAPGLYYLMVDGYQDGVGDTCPCGPYQLTLTGL